LSTKPWSMASWKTAFTVELMLGSLAVTVIP
jgi:hypothetical protein